MATFLRTRSTLTTGSGISSALLTHYWDSTGAAQNLLVTEALARVRAFWISLQGNIGATTLLTYNPVADEIEETTGQIVAQVTGTAPATVAGTGVGDTLPLQTQAVLRYSTNTYINGRRLQGRSFLPYVIETLNAGTGQPSAAFVTAVNTAAALLSTTIVTPVNQRVWHRPNGAVPGLSSVVTARSCSTTWGVLRSRRN